MTDRQRLLQVQQNLPFHIHPPIVCSGCGAEIHDEYIAGSCKSCNIDFCDECFDSGIPIDELLEERQLLQEELESRFDAPTVSMSLSDMTMSVTDEQCSMGHQLCRVLTIRRKRYLQDRDGLATLPTIECDCCSKNILSEQIAGCCVECDLDFCEDCFQNGQSFDDMVQEPILMGEEMPQVAHGGRYNRRRPTYKGTGRVSYDDYPDPAALQWAFTGSDEEACVEFFEKDFGSRIGVVKLDFYYTKGQLRTVLEHRKKGPRKLFIKDNKLSPKLFRKILREPITYREKSSKKKSKLVV